jgi:tetratricopeptide (TPR) repeat protein
LAAFAHDLRVLREAAGNPPYRALAKRAGYSATTLSVAASATVMPSLDVTLAYVQACGGDAAAWRARWRELSDVMRLAAVIGSGAQATPAPAAVSATLVPRQLPRSVRHFTGRAGEVARLTGLLQDLAVPERPVAISAVGGAGGVGKTALAVHWAHLHAGRFPDGQLFVNLRGFGPSMRPLSTEEALRGFLIALGVAPAAIPAGQEAQGGLYRSLVADKRMLVVLDNAADTDQIAALLPGGARCAVLVTSRLRLEGLAAAHGAAMLELDALARDEAERLLVHHVGADRSAAEPEAVAELLTYCAGLPLAVGIAAARAAAHPDFPLAVLADELRDRTRRLDALSSPDTALGLSAVLSWSHRALGEQAANLFTLLGLAPGTEFGLPVTASLAALPLPRARCLLRELETAHLVVQPRPGRYRMHDLLQLYAVRQARSTLPDEPRSAAERRLADFYLHTANHAERHLYPQRPPLTLSEPAAGCHLLSIRGQDEALAWIDTEYPNLQAMHQLAVERGQHELIWQLAWILSTYRVRRGLVHDHLAAWQAALAAAQHLDDPGTAALIQRSYGSALTRAGRPAEGLGHLREALVLTEEHGDTVNLGLTRFQLALTYHALGDHRQALDHATHALELFQSADDPVWQSQALAFAGRYAAQLGNHELALDHAEAALALSRRQHYPDGEADALANLAYLAQQTGDPARALRYHRSALALFRELGNTHFEADNLEQLGHTLTALGQHEQARHTWHQALRLYRDQHRLAEADRIQRHTATLASTPRGLYRTKPMRAR